MEAYALMLTLVLDTPAAGNAVPKISKGVAR